MTKLLKILAICVLFVFLLAACAPVAQGLVGLPEEGRALVVTLLSAGLTWVLLKLGELLKIDLGGYVQPLVAALAPIVVVVIEKYLLLIPSQYDDIVTVLIHLLVVILGNIGLFVLVSKARGKKFRQLLA